MHHCTARLGPPRGLLAALATLAALGLSGVAGCRTAAALADGLAERQGTYGVEIEASDLPKWWLPMYGANEASPFDGHLTGFAVRLGGGYFLADTESVDRAAQLQKNTERLYGLFDYYPRTKTNLNSNFDYDKAYAPELAATFEGDIGLYKMKPRPEFPNAKPLHEIYPLETSVCLQRDATVKPENCSIITYGDDVHARYGARANSTRRLMEIGVREKVCKNSICAMYTERRGKKWGALCGFYSNLGNPIVCGAGPLKKITYLFWALDHEGRRGGLTRNCTITFRAVKVASIADRVWNTHTALVRG